MKWLLSWQAAVYVSIAIMLVGILADSVSSVIAGGALLLYLAISRR